IPAFNPIKLHAEAAAQEPGPDINDRFVKVEETDLDGTGLLSGAETEALSLDEVRLAVREAAEFTPTQIAYASGGGEALGSGDAAFAELGRAGLSFGDIRAGFLKTAPQPGG